MTGLPDGAPAPDFELRDQHGQTYRLSSFQGQRNVVLVFYPWAFTSVCTSELCDLRDAWPTFASHEVEIVAISCDPVYSLRVFADQDGIHFPLLSDFWPHGAVASSYGVLDETTGAANRSTFIIDRAGTVRWTVHNAGPQARDLSEQLRVLSGLDT